MIAGVGIDLVAVARVERLLNTHGQRFVDRCFSPDEIVRGQDPEHLAGLLAAKEAAFKALAAPALSGIGWRGLAILHDPGSGRPVLVFRDRAKDVAQQRRIGPAHLSISHQAGMAVALVILETGPA
jgi:holo-[acyl-carrier protein] synthase